MAAAAPGAVFMVDDVSSRFPKVQHVWQSFVNKGRLRQRACVSITLPPPAGLKGWCVGTKAPARTKKPEAAASRRAPPLGHSVDFLDLRLGRVGEDATRATAYACRPGQDCSATSRNRASPANSIVPG